MFWCEFLGAKTYVDCVQDRGAAFFKHDFLFLNFYFFVKNTFWPEKNENNWFKKKTKLKKTFIVLGILLYISKYKNYFENKNLSIKYFYSKICVNMCSRSWKYMSRCDRWWKKWKAIYFMCCYSVLSISTRINISSQISSKFR